MNDEKMKPVDLNDLYLEDENLQLDPDADAFQGPPPPPDGSAPRQARPVPA